MAVAIHRWYVKKAMRAVATAVGLPIALANQIGSRSNIHVLTYHRFGDETREPFCVDTQSFERQMREIPRGAVISLSDLRAMLTGSRPSPGPKVLVTIDDGDPSVYTVALPILAKYEIPAVVFAVTSWIGASSHMSALQLRALETANITVMSHSANHQFMAQLSTQDARSEAMASRQKLEDILGHEVTVFAYPYGTRAAFNANTLEILRESGYDLAFTSQHGSVRKNSAPLELPRIKVESGDPQWHFNMLCKGAMNSWYLVDRTLSMLQGPQFNRYR